MVFVTPVSVYEILTDVCPDAKLFPLVTVKLFTVFVCPFLYVTRTDNPVLSKFSPTTYLFLALPTISIF